MRSSFGIGRRGFVVAGASGIVSLAGCLGDVGGSSGPQERSFDLTITQSGGTLDMSVEPAGEVVDVVRVRVGDTVAFTVANDAPGPVGFHNHANDAEMIIEAGGVRSMEFEVTEAMTGRQEIEGWIAEGDTAPEEDEHGEGATTLAIIEVRPRGS